jgi:hypothetical protein
MRLMRYWKPWQPPLSTRIRNARLGFLSFAMISESRYIRKLIRCCWNRARNYRTRLIK